jgi:hypothetical protein
MVSLIMKTFLAYSQYYCGWIAVPITSKPAMVAVPSLGSKVWSISGKSLFSCTSGPINQDFSFFDIKETDRNGQVVL